VPSSENLRKYRNSADKLDSQVLEFLKAMYDSGIRYTDDTLRDMFNELDDLGFLRNCLVIITADHGEEFGEHGGLVHRSTLYDDLLHVPLVVTGTGVPTGLVSERMSSTVDIVPTILGYLRIKPSLPFMGHDLLAPVESDGEQGQSHAVFSQYGNLRYAIRTFEWKLIQNIGTVELFDVRKDPGELENVAEQYPEVVADLDGRIRAWKLSLPTMQTIEDREAKLTDEEKDKLRSLGYIP